MFIMRNKIFSIVILAVSVLATTPAWAGQQAVTTAQLDTEFGTVIAGDGPVESSGPFWTLSVSVEVRKKLDIYTYIFHLDSSPPANILLFTVASAQFDPALNWGNIDGPDIGPASFNENLTFDFGAAAATSMTVYAQFQSTDPEPYLGSFDVWATNGLTSGIATLAPSTVVTPEPGTLLLLGTGLLGGGVARFRKRFK